VSDGFLAAKQGFDLQLLVAEEDGEWRVVDDSVDLFSKLEQRLERYGFQFGEEN